MARRPFLPISVEVLGRECPIVWDAKVEREEGSDVDPWGEYEGMACRINVDRKVTDPERRLRTLIHEMVHAGLDVSGWGELLKVKVEEGLCTLMEQLILPNIETLYKLKKEIAGE